MTLKPGTWLNHYEILAHIGSGGMGEVYRARDNKLNREVALKVLPEHFARDPEESSCSGYRGPPYCCGGGRVHGKAEKSRQNKLFFCETKPN